MELASSGTETDLSAPGRGSLMHIGCEEKKTMWLAYKLLDFKWSIVPSLTWACVCAQLLQSCLILCNPMDCSPPGSSVYGISQARILEWVAMPSSRGSSWPRNWTHVSCTSKIGKRILYPPGSPVLVVLPFFFFFFFFLLRVCVK